MTSTDSPTDSIADLGEPGRQLMQLLAGHALVGLERSVKISARGLATDRILVGIDRSSLDKEAWQALWTSLAMPEALQSEAARHLDGANQVLFGYEGDDAGGSLRVYLEFWDQLAARLEADDTNRRPQVLYLGYKWQVEGSSDDRITRYECLPMLTAGRIQRRVREHFEGDGVEGDGAAPFLAFVDEVFEALKASPDRDLMVYTRADEQTGARDSFDVDVSRQGLGVGVVSAALQRLVEALGLPEAALHGEIDRMARIGHIAGGIDRDGGPFLTVYYEPVQAS